MEVPARVPESNEYASTPQRGVSARVRVSRSSTRGHWSQYERALASACAPSSWFAGYKSLSPITQLTRGASNRDRVERPCRRSAVRPRRGRRLLPTRSGRDGPEGDSRTGLNQPLWRQGDFERLFRPSNRQFVRDRALEDFVDPCQPFRAGGLA